MACRPDWHPQTCSMARRLRDQFGIKIEPTPAVFLLDGSVLADPSDAEIMDAIGENPNELVCDVAVIGGGPAGLAPQRFTPDPRGCERS